MAVYGDEREQTPEESDNTVLISRSRPVPPATIRVFLAQQPAPRVVWHPPNGPTIAAAGTAATITSNGPARFQSIQQTASDVFAKLDLDQDSPPAARPRLFGGFAFHPDHTPAAPWRGFPSAEFVLPRVQYTRTGTQSTLTINAYRPTATPETVESTLSEAIEALANRPTPATSTPPGVADIERIPSRQTWRRGVETALDRIAAGTLDKVVLAQALKATLTTPIDPPATLNRLGERYPDCYRFLFAPTEAATMFGATPERLIARQGRSVETEAIAGSIGRGDTPTEDETLAATLRESTKDQHEQSIVVNAIQDQLEPLAVSVRTGDQRVRRLATVQHLQTPIRARLATDQHIISLVEALHPTPAVGGLPPDAAQTTIREAESFKRGWYAAPLGWFDASGNGEFIVAIRSAVSTDRTATLFAGAGIVTDSDPESEWEEVQLKYRPILDALTE